MKPPCLGYFRAPLSGLILPRCGAPSGQALNEAHTIFQVRAWTAHDEFRTSTQAGMPLQVPTIPVRII